MSVGFLCEKCPGHCCSSAGYVGVHRADVQRLASHHGMGYEAAVGKFIETSPVRAWGLPRFAYNDEVGALRKDGPDHEKDPCTFLREGKCSVYEARPDTCRDYGMKECVEDRFPQRLGKWAVGYVQANPLRRVLARIIRG